MARVKQTKPLRPATTLEGRENQLISLASNLAEEQIRNGTASSQVITHFLKLGSSRERLEQARLSRETRLLDAKVDQIESGQRIETLYKTALNAMRQYAGRDDIALDYDDEGVDGYYE